MKGFTLVEILVVTAILVALMFGAFQVMETGRFSWLSGDASVEIRQDIIQAFMWMERELKETRPAQISLGSGTTSASLTFNMPQDNDSDGTVLDSSGNVEWSEDIIYALNGSGEITRTVSGVTVVIAKNVTNLEFSRPVSPVDILQIDITASKNFAVGKTMQESGQLIIKMRN